MMSFAEQYEKCQKECRQAMMGLYKDFEADTFLEVPEGRGG
jgi:hypothetical protein